MIQWKKSKKKNARGSYFYQILGRYTLTEEEICEQETAKLRDEMSDNDDYDYFVEIEKTIS